MLDLNNVTSGYSTNVINNNFSEIERYINENLLNRDGVNPGEPNQMEVDLDMNSQDVINVGNIGAKEVFLDGVPVKKFFEDSVIVVGGEVEKARDEADRAKHEADRAEQAAEDLDGPYSFLADYGPGIVVTKYNQVVRNSDGEFWRVSGQVDLPYTTTGESLPEGGAFVPVGDAYLRQELANPDMGAAGVARAPICVDSISSLLALPLGQRKPGITYLVGSYHTGMSLGGNRYAYRPNLPASLHDGGRYISPQKNFPGDWGDKAAQAAWFTPPTSGLGVFELEKSEHAMCVSDFGVRPDVDCSAALQAALNYSQFTCNIALDVSAPYSETLVVKTGMGLAGDGYNHNIRASLTTNVLRYYGTGDGIRVEGLADLTARTIVLRDFHLVDELGTADRGLVGYDIIGSHVDLSIAGFNRTCVVQRYLYYINKFAIFGQGYRRGGIVIGGNINEGTVTFKLISTSETLDTGFMVGSNLSEEGVAASASFNPTIEGSVEQNSGRHHSIAQVRGGKIKIYYESPGSGVFASSHAALSRLYSADITVYGSSKSQFGVYTSDCRDSSFAGELKGATTADFYATTGFGLDTSKLLAGTALTSSFVTGSVVGRASAGAVVRNAYGSSSALPTSGAFGVGSQLIYTNSVPPVEGKKEIGKIVTRAGSFGTLSGVRGTGVAGENTLAFTAGQQFVLVGDYLALPDNTGAFLIEYLYQSAGSTVVRLNRSIDTSFTDAPITYSAPEVQPITVGVG